VLAYAQCAASFLVRHGVETPRLDAEVLLAHVLATDRVGVYLRFDQPLEMAEVDAYRAIVRRRAAGEPVAYLTGHREFWSREFTVTPDVLVPRPETELLIERALAVAPDSDRPVRILDLGTGSGALAVTLASKRPAASVVALDVSVGAAAIARRNAQSAGVGDRVLVAVGDWAAPLAPEARFDLIVSNPPYVPTAALDMLAREVRREPAVALDGGADGLAAYRRLVPAAATLLAPAACLLVEVGAGQAAAVAALFARCGLAEIVCYADLAGVDRVVAGSAERVAAGIAV
jgi:release factor glutamine methyltransferase